MCINFSFNSKIILLAVLGPIPGIIVNDLTSSDNILLIKILGFDPDNPKVKAEISRIIARGPNSRPSGNPQSASENFDQLALGYSEDIIGIDQEIVGSENLSLTENELNQESNSIEKITEGSEEIEMGKKENIQKYFKLSPLFWSVIFVVFVALGGGGLVLLRNRY